MHCRSFISPSLAAAAGVHGVTVMGGLFFIGLKLLVEGV